MSISKDDRTVLDLTSKISGSFFVNWTQAFGFRNFGDFDSYPIARHILRYILHPSSRGLNIKHSSLIMWKTNLIFWLNDCKKFFC